jgi:hypothetical protein
VLVPLSEEAACENLTLSKHHRESGSTT